MAKRVFNENCNKTSCHFNSSWSYDFSGFAKIYVPGSFYPWPYI